MCGMDLISPIILIGINTNGASVIVIIDWGIAIKYNGTYFIVSILKFEVFA
jgi:hypothetical protein